jgi:hypothetical protein
MGNEPIPRIDYIPKLPKLRNRSDIQSGKDILNPARKPPMALYAEKPYWRTAMVAKNSLRNQEKLLLLQSTVCTEKPSRLYVGIPTR